MDRHIEINTLQLTNLFVAGAVGYQIIHVFCMVCVHPLSRREDMMIPKSIITLINMVCFPIYLSESWWTFFADLENLGALTFFCTFVLWSLEFTVLTAKELNGGNHSSWENWAEKQAQIAMKVYKKSMVESVLSRRLSNQMRKAAQVSSMGQHWYTHLWSLGPGVTTADTTWGDSRQRAHGMHLKM